MALTKITTGEITDGTITSVILTTPAILNDMMQVTYKKPGGAMIINNVDHLITSEDSRLQLEYKRKATEGNVHKQWSLLRKNDPRSTIPSYFLNKMLHFKIYLVTNFKNHVKIE